MNLSGDKKKLCFAIGCRGEGGGELYKECKAGALHRLSKHLLPPPCADGQCTRPSLVPLWHSSCTSCISMHTAHCTLCALQWASDCTLHSWTTLTTELYCSLPQCSLPSMPTLGSWGQWTPPPLGPRSTKALSPLLTTWCQCFSFSAL